MTVQGRYPIPAEYGQRVRFTAGGERPPSGQQHGEGVFTLAWLGIEEVWNVVTDDGRTVHLYPYMGDTMEVLDPTAPPAEKYRGPDGDEYAITPQGPRRMGNPTMTQRPQ